MGILRLLLALSVVAAHCGAIFGLNLVGGQIAVQSFYIISGFYMSLIINEKYIGANNSYKLFITNRFLRLYPIYWGVLFLTILACVGIGIINKGHYIPVIDSYRSVKANFLSFGYLIVSNVILFGQDIVMFLGINPGNGHLFFTSNFKNTNPPLYNFLFIQQAWTLGVELTFYLVAPLIVRKRPGVVFTLILLSFMLRMFIYNYLGFKNDPWTYRFFPTEIMFFLLGYFAYRILLMLNKRPIKTSIGFSVLCFIVLFTILYPYLPSMKVDYFPFSIKECLYFLSITFAIPVLFNFLKKNRLDNQIGELSYPVYISHMLIMMIFSSPHFAPYNVSWVMAGITIIFSFLLNKFITSPLERYRQSRLKK